MVAGPEHNNQHLLHWGKELDLHSLVISSQTKVDVMRLLKRINAQFRLDEQFSRSLAFASHNLGFLI